MENPHYNLSGFLEYQEGILCVDGVPYSEILSDQYSPTICVSLDRAKSNVRFLQTRLVSVDHSIHYAIKASYLKPLVMAIQKQGAGAEVISEYEWNLALKAGFSGKQIVMNGLGRTAEELMMAINSGAIVNIDSLSELKKLCPFADVFKESHQNIGLRVHPCFEGDGNFVQRDGKLGMNYSEIRECVLFAKEIGLNVNGFSFHVFSNQVNPDSYKSALKSLADFTRVIEKDFNIRCDYIDIGGGIAPRMFFESDGALESFLADIISSFKRYYPSHTGLIMEPGRYIVADAVVIFSRIKTIKRNNGGTWAVLDIGTNYLIPAPGSNFKILPCEHSPGGASESEMVKFVDGICSPAGFIGEAFVDVDEGQMVAIVNSGAYTSVMREEFVFGSPRCIYLENGKIAEIKKKTSFEEFSNYHGWE